MSARPILYERFPALRATLPHLALDREGATPVRRLAGLETPGGCEMWVKDDGAFAEPMGGNKPRKLEWILADARRRGFGSVLTVGALGTNHGLATALYGRRAGLDTVLALVDQPLDAHVQRQFERIVDSGASIHLTRGTVRTAAAVPWLMARHFDLRHRRPPYFLGVGGSSPVGCVGFVEAAFELAGQVTAGVLPEPSHVAVAARLGRHGGGAGAGVADGRTAHAGRRRAGQRQDAARRAADRTACAAHRAAPARARGARFETVVVAAATSVRARLPRGGLGHRAVKQGETASRSSHRRAPESWRLDPVYTGQDDGRPARATGAAEPRPKVRCCTGTRTTRSGTRTRRSRSTSAARDEPVQHAVQAPRRSPACACPAPPGSAYVVCVR